MTDLYFECSGGISGDMSVGALLDLGASKQNLLNVLKSIGMDDEFTCEIKEVKINSIKASDFNVILHNEHKECSCHHHHHHRNLNDVINIIEKSSATNNAKFLAKKIFKIVADAESKVHGLPLDEVHFHEIGAVDSIADILSFAVLFDELNVNKVYFSPLSEGSGTVECQHGVMSVPVPAVCEIVSKYELPIKITENIGEMITPTGAAIAAAIHTKESLPESFIIKKIGYGSGKRKYRNPVLRVLSISDN